MENEKTVDDTLELFFNQFGKIDIYTKIVLEEFFKEILNEKSNVYLSSEEKQEGN